MKNHPSWQRILLASLAALALVTGLGLLALPAPLSAEASPGAGAYTLDWWTVDGGGQTGGDGSGYDLQGTVGQPDAAVWHGGDYTLAGGFWPDASPLAGLLHVYLPLVLR